MMLLLISKELARTTEPGPAGNIKFPGCILGRAGPVLAVLLACAAIAAAQSGEALFLQHCGPCHGAHGWDGFGANLAQPRLPRAPDDASLAGLVRNGLPGTDMTPAFGVTATEVDRIVTYVRSLGRTPPQKVAGNAARGREVYNRENCATCHMLQGKGGRHGPDLSDMGVRR